MHTHIAFGTMVNFTNFVHLSARSIIQSIEFAFDQTSTAP